MKNFEFIQNLKNNTVKNNLMFGNLARKDFF